MRTSMPWLSAMLLLGMFGLMPSRDVLAQSTIAGITSEVGFDQKLGDEIPLNLRFRNEMGREIRLGDYFGERPVILVLLYYRCPLLCSQVLNGLTRSLRPLSASAGMDFDVLAVSISPEETPKLANQKRSAYLDRYDRPGTEHGWHFLVGEQGPIGELAGTVGFRFKYNPQTKLYAHAAGIVILTPSGRIARYFYGIDYPPKELQNELVRAEAGKIGSPIGRLLLLCYDYDAATGKYTLSIVRLLRVLGTVTALSLGAFLGVMFRRERRARLDGASSCSSTRPDPSGVPSVHC
jgi:protein SCO1